MNPDAKNNNFKYASSIQTDKTAISFEQLKQRPAAGSSAIATSSIECRLFCLLRVRN